MNNQIQTQSTSSLRRWLLSPQAQTDLAAVANGTMSGERLSNILYQCVNRTPELQKVSLPDLFTATKTLILMGCEPDNIHGYLVPRWCRRGKEYVVVPVPIPSARGLMRMARANGVQNLNIGTVYESDSFEWFIRNGHFNMSHVQSWSPGGEILGFYCTWEDSHGNLHGERMNTAEVNAIRERSDAYRKCQEKNIPCPWTTDYEQMALKTVIKRASKRWDLPLEIKQAIHDSTAAEFEDDKTLMREARIREAAPENLPPPATEQNAIAYEGPATAAETEAESDFIPGLEPMEEKAPSPRPYND